MASADVAAGVASGSGPAAAPPALGRYCRDVEVRNAGARFNLVGGESVVFGRETVIADLGGCLYSTGAVASQAAPVDVDRVCARDDALLGALLEGSRGQLDDGCLSQLDLGADEYYDEGGQSPALGIGGLPNAPPPACEGGLPSVVVVGGVSADAAAGPFLVQLETNVGVFFVDDAKCGGAGVEATALVATSVADEAACVALGSLEDCIAGLARPWLAARLGCTLEVLVGAIADAFALGCHNRADLAAAVLHHFRRG